jgi:hypothetical protein
VSATPDPTDAKADGNFGSAGGSHRAGYGDRLANAEKWARKGGTLNAGEGAVLCEEIDRLRERLAAATRVTDEMVERAAEALYLRGDLSHWGTWEQEIWRYKETYYEDARAILAAALETQEGA